MKEYKKLTIKIATLDKDVITWSIWQDNDTQDDVWFAN